jgi:hypothetical protein
VPGVCRGLGSITHPHADQAWLVRRLIYDPVEWGCAEDEVISLGLGELREIDRDRISRMKTYELDRLVAAGTIREIDREHVRFIVRRIVQAAARPDDPLPENAVGSD